MWRLPVSGTDVMLRRPRGEDDLLLCESTDNGVRLALELASRLARRSDGAELAWEAATLTDLDAVLIFIRSVEFGYQLRAETVCPSPSCRRRIDVSFGLDGYLSSNQPAVPRGLTAAGDGWYRLRELPALFRLPTAGDLIAALPEVDPASFLYEACIQPQPAPASCRLQLERAMSVMAPNLARDLQVACPECGDSISVRFDPLDYTLRELRGPAADVHEEVHILASTYHWREADILALPRQRRTAYVEIAEQARSVN